MAKGNGLEPMLIGMWKAMGSTALRKAMDLNPWPKAMALSPWPRGFSACPESMAWPSAVALSDGRRPWALACGLQPMAEAHGTSRPWAMVEGSPMVKGHGLRLRPKAMGFSPWPKHGLVPMA